MATTIELPDGSNNPSKVVLNGIILPEDVIIGLDGDKVVAESKILDGTEVYERISKKPFEINFEFTVREKNVLGNYVFPQATIQVLVDTVWQPDAVVPVVNTFLNSLHIRYVIIRPITFATIRGNTNVVCSIKCKESTDNGNIYGQTLIIPV